jgi:hypothetical protein
MFEYRNYFLLRYVDLHKESGLVYNLEKGPYWSGIDRCTKSCCLDKRYANSDNKVDVQDYKKYLEEKSSP